MIILITASLSSNTYNKNSWCEDWTFEGSETRETFPRKETIRSHNSRASKPSNLSPVSKEMISDSVELGETAVCFLHIQLVGKMYDFRKCTMFFQKWISNFQDLPRSQSLETVPVCIVWQYYPLDNIVNIHMYDEFLKSIDSGVCHRSWSIL